MEYLQLSRADASSHRWVELPNCSGATGEVPLEPDNENGGAPLNATWATCKPATAPGA